MLIAFSVAPSGTGDSVSAAVADAVRVVRESRLPHRTDAMFTTIEGEWDECMDVVRRACEAVGQPGERQGKLDRLEAAIERGGGSGQVAETPDSTADGVPDGATDEGYASPS